MLSGRQKVGRKGLLFCEWKSTMLVNEIFQRTVYATFDVVRCSGDGWVVNVGKQLGKSLSEQMTH